MSAETNINWHLACKRFTETSSSHLFISPRAGLHFKFFRVYTTTTIHKKIHETNWAEHLKRVSIVETTATKILIQSQEWKSLCQCYKSPSCGCTVGNTEGTQDSGDKQIQEITVHQ